jgi:hypothetical protein
MGQIAAYKTKEGLAEIGKRAIGFLHSAIRESVDRFGDDQYAQAIDVGIRNTVSALVEARVKDEMVIFLLNKYWGIVRDDATDMLADEKRDYPFRELYSYLKLQGWSRMDINDFMRDTKAELRLGHERELRELKPKELKMALEKKPVKRV